MINVFIIGSKGLPARYGGFETFIDFLTKEKVNTNIHYFVSCMGGTGVEVINGATCFHIPFKIGGPFGRTINVWDAIRWTRSHIKRDYPHDGNIIYILGCRIGPFLKKAKKVCKRLVPLSFAIRMDSNGRGANGTGPKNQLFYFSRNNL
jgi:rhamnosyltransferase